MFHAVGAASALGLEIDAASALSSLAALIKKDDGILAMGYSFHIAAAVGGISLKFSSRLPDGVTAGARVSFLNL